MANIDEYIQTIINWPNYIYQEIQPKLEEISEKIEPIMDVRVKRGNALMDIDLKAVDPDEDDPEEIMEEIQDVIDDFVKEDGISVVDSDWGSDMTAGWELSLEGVLGTDQTIRTII